MSNPRNDEAWLQADDREDFRLETEDWRKDPIAQKEYREWLESLNEPQRRAA